MSTSEPGLVNKATFIDGYLKFHHSEAAFLHLHIGRAMFDAGSEHSVDPLILLAIAGYATNFGKEGCKMDGLLGVGVDDGEDDPDGSFRIADRFRGPLEQISEGAKLFQELRAANHSSASQPVSHQLEAVHRGWTTQDQSWATGVLAVYREVMEAAHRV